MQTDRRDFLRKAAIFGGVVVAGPTLTASRVLAATTSTVSIPSSIDKTGATDVTAALTSFFAGVANDTQVNFPTNGIYRIDNPLVITDKKGLLLQGNGSLLKADKLGLQFVGGGVSSAGNNLTVNNLKIKGSNAAGGLNSPDPGSREGQHCMALSGVKGFVLTNGEHSYPWGDLFYTGTRKIGPASGGQSSYDKCSNVWVSNCNFHHCGRQGVTVQGVTNIYVVTNTIDQIKRSTVDLEPTAEAFNGVDTFHFQNNTVGLGNLNFIASQGSGPVNNVWIEGNTVGRALNIDVKDLNGARRSGWHVNNNVASGVLPGNPQGRVMAFTNVDGVQVTGNTQAMQANRNMALVLATTCTGIDVHGNTITNGIELRTA